MKQIEGYENYSITEDGRVWNTKRNKLLKSRLGKNGYFYLALSKQNKLKWCYIHRLLAEAYIPNPENKTQVNHKDMNRSNNNLDNLEWMTCSENNLHAFQNGRVHSEEARFKMSESKKGKKQSEESRRKRSESMKATLLKKKTLSELTERVL